MFLLLIVAAKNSRKVATDQQATVVLHQAVGLGPGRKPRRAMGLARPVAEVLDHGVGQQAEQQNRRHDKGRGQQEEVTHASAREAERIGQQISGDHQDNEHDDGDDHHADDVSAGTEGAGDDSDDRPYGIARGGTQHVAESPPGDHGAALDAG